MQAIYTQIYTWIYTTILSWLVQFRGLGDTLYIIHNHSKSFMCEDIRETEAVTSCRGLERNHVMPNRGAQ